MIPQLDTTPNTWIPREYLTAAEAAEYAGMPLADFLALVRRYGILSFHLYRKADVKTAMEQAAAMGRARG